MSIHYAIHEELNLVFIFCQDEITAQEYFATMRALSQEPAYQPGMLKLVDLFSPRENFHLVDMREALAYMRDQAAHGQAVDHTVLLTGSLGIQQLVATMKLLSQQVALKFEAFTTLQDALRAIGLSAQEQELLAFYQAAQ